MNQLVMTYWQHNVQKNAQFFASFCTNYFVNPNNLLTHTHTRTLSLSLLTYIASKYFCVRALKARVTPIDEGLTRVPFVSIFASFYEQKMNEITLQSVRRNGSCVHSVRNKWAYEQADKQVNS